MSPRTDPVAFALGVLALAGGVVFAVVLVRAVAGEVARARAERREDRVLPARTPVEDEWPPCGGGRTGRR